MALRPTMCPQAQTSLDQTKYLRGMNISPPPPPMGIEATEPRGDSGEVMRSTSEAQSGTTAQRSKKRQCVRAVYIECMSSMERSGGSRSKGGGQAPALIRREGRVTDQLIRDHSCESSVRATVAPQASETTEQLIYGRRKEGRRTAALVVSCCRLENTNTWFITFYSCFFFLFLPVSLQLNLVSWNVEKFLKSVMFQING